MPGETHDPVAFARLHSGLVLRAYQQEVARAVVDSVLNGRGLSLVVMFPRQSGKNELQAQIETFLLHHLREQGAEMIKVSPTWRPQSQNAMRRLERVLARNPLTAKDWGKESGYLFRLGQARIAFYSGAPESNIVGATASTLLEVDEAQDVRIDKFDRDIAPMAASTNATRVFWGTAWTSRTLLARELRAAREAEQQDGLRRAFVLGAEAVAAELPAYQVFVGEQIARLGRQHPMVKSQYFSEEIDAQAGMFPPERVARMLVSGPAGGPGSGRTGGPLVLLIDVAGQDESAQGSQDSRRQLERLANPKRDSTALTLVQVDLSSLSNPLLRAPTYRVMLRRQWTGVNHADIYGELSALIRAVRAHSVVIDATGVGAGLASFLERILPKRVQRIIFTQSSKSKLGWGFIDVVDEGRWVETDQGQALAALAAAGANLSALASAAPGHDLTLRAQFLHELAFCQYEVLPGPGKTMRWGVPDGTRDPASGAWVHDDWIISAALCAHLDEQDWSHTLLSPHTAGIVRARDPLDDMRSF